MPLSGQVDGHRLVPRLRRQMADRCQCRQHGGVGDEPVKPSPPTGNCRGKPWDGRRIPHVQFHDGGRTSGSLDLVIDLFKRADGTTGDDDLRPGCGCGDGNGAADAAGCAGYQYQFAGEIDFMLCHQLALPCETRLALSPLASRIG